MNMPHDFFAKRLAAIEQAEARRLAVIEEEKAPSGRRPIIRRADLGAMGTYYRTLVGPFASTEKATRFCSKLKAAGGDCIIQKH